MKKLSVFFCLIILTSCMEKIFSVSPYFLRTDKNEIILKFRPKKAGDVIVKVFKKTGKNNFFPIKELKKEFAKKTVVEVNLGEQLCSEEMKVTLSSSGFTEFGELEKTISSYPCENEIRFGVISDTQTSRRRHKAVGKQLSTYENLAFNIHLGDVVDYAIHQFQWKKYFDSASPTYLKKAPIISVVGNHAYYNLLAHWVGKGPVPKKFGEYLRWDGSPEIGYLSIVFAQFEMIVINSILEKLTEEEVKKQWIWMEEKLKIAKAEGRPVIVTMHYSPFCSTKGGCTGKDEMILKKDMVPLLEKYGVKLVLTGHTHIYERLFRNGVNYVIAGPAGGRSGKLGRKDENQVLVIQKVSTFSIVSVDKERILVKTMNKKNEVIDSLRIEIK